MGAAAGQIRSNADFLNNTYGVDGTPYFRPPYGHHNADTDRVAADQGYTTITMWSGTIGDSLPENETSLIADAGNSFEPQQVVLAHANLPTITHCYAQLLDIIQSRNLQTVTLNDVFRNQRTRDSRRAKTAPPTSASFSRLLSQVGADALHYGPLWPGSRKTIIPAIRRQQWPSAHSVLPPSWSGSRTLALPRHL